MAFCVELELIDNTEKVLLTLNKKNNFSTARHLDSYDFSTLYTLKTP